MRVHEANEVFGSCPCLEHCKHHGVELFLEDDPMPIFIDHQQAGLPLLCLIDDLICSFLIPECPSIDSECMLMRWRDGEISRFFCLHDECKVMNAFFILKLVVAVFLHLLIDKSSLLVDTGLLFSPVLFLLLPLAFKLGNYLLMGFLFCFLVLLVGLPGLCIHLLDELFFLVWMH